MTHTVGRIEMHAGFLWGSIKERDHLEDLVIGGSIILNSFKDVGSIRVEWIFSFKIRRTGVIF
jgi:hypothetical protein